ncbi:MAG: carboxylating nicotinate-nucleotide diphosphorylase [Saprospiraceae bacterium]|nr:carboxylating nicotinate-nucleotide diphosphorylase [Saprospiraceae bacterium]
MSATINQIELQDFIARGLREDIGNGDHTSLACIPSDAKAKAILKVKDVGVLAGVEVAKQILLTVDPNAIVNILIQDGTPVHVGDIAFEVEANTHALLKAERLLLNTMQRMTGIATLSNQYFFEVEDLPVTILDTRKTTPNIRFLEKWAVRLGGCTNYRIGLYDRFMIKDNHVEAAGGVKNAINKVLEYRKANHLEDLKITVEVRNLVELYDAMEAGKGTIDRIMLDNFELPLLVEAVEVIGDQFESEASGGINLHTIRQVAMTGVQYISVGALTHSAQSLDLSFKIIG